MLIIIIVAVEAAHYPPEIVYRNAPSSILDSFTGLNDPFLHFPHLQKNLLETDISSIERMVAECREAKDFIATFVVQGRMNNRGNYSEWSDKVPDTIDAPGSF